MPEKCYHFLSQKLLIFVTLLQINKISFAIFPYHLLRLLAICIIVIKSEYFVLKSNTIVCFLCKTLLQYFLQLFKLIHYLYIINHMFDNFNMFKELYNIIDS
jgi:hypothetical protein